MKKLDDATLMLKAKRLLLCMSELSELVPPQEFKAILSGAIASVLGNLPERYWREFSKVEPCGKPGCDCHLIVMPTATKLYACLREDYNKHGAATQEVVE